MQPRPLSTPDQGMQVDRDCGDLISISSKPQCGEPDSYFLPKDLCAIQTLHHHGMMPLQKPMFYIKLKYTAHLLD